MTQRYLLGAVFASSLAAVQLAAATLPTSDAVTEAMASAVAKAAYEHDRQSILAMNGTYKVTFDFRETAAFVAGYKPIPAKTSGGHEVVKVVEDTGTTISLQHLLVVKDDKGVASVVKHWRQTWQYEPTEVLVYALANHWVLRPTTPGERTHAWSQVVWQTDDSPRYGGLGNWRYDDQVARWSSDATLRPLARRDAVRHPVYDRYLGTNRHALTPSGWVHEQDNAKLGTRDGKTVTYVHEVVVNSYERAADFDTRIAETYWEKTRNYWAAVRGDWDNVIHAHGGIAVAEEAENGSKTGPTLMKLADRVANGELTMPAAIAQAQDVIAATAAMSEKPRAGATAQR